jgi:hypothetical protein
VAARLATSGGVRSLLALLAVADPPTQRLTVRLLTTLLRSADFGDGSGAVSGFRGSEWGHGGGGGGGSSAAGTLHSASAESLSRTAVVRELCRLHSAATFAPSTDGLSAHERQVPLHGRGNIGWSLAYEEKWGSDSSYLKVFSAARVGLILVMLRSRRFCSQNLCLF